ncbi:DUF3157 family protein [Tenacibaculum todarodis]|nr:DUF3157 family protein [Tenacibaculum todarodis]
MKKIIFINLLLITSLSFAQTKIATTEDGKKVLLKDDKTWEYLNPDTKPKNSCVVDANFKEPKWKKSSSWKRMGTRVDDLKKHISVDLGIDEKKIILLSLSEQLGNAVYQLCVDGTKMKYRRTGSVFRKDGEDVLKMD